MGLLEGSLLPALLLLALTVAYFFPLFRGYTFTTVAGHHLGAYPWRAFDPQYTDYPQSDQADLSYPWQAFESGAFQRLAFPFWNPYSFGGQPFFANGSSAVLYPPHLLATLLLTPDWAHDVLSFFHVFSSGFFMYLLLREFETSIAGAVLAAIAWMFSSFNMAWLHLEVVAPVSAWLPLSVMLVSRALRRSSWSAALGAAVALASVLVSGHLLFCGLVYGVAVAYAGCLATARLLRDSPPRHSTGPLRSAHATLLCLGLVALGPLCLAAVVLLPTLLFLLGLGRETNAYLLAHEGIHVPYRVFWHLLRPPPLPVTETTMHQMAFLGLLPALFAAVGFFKRSPGTMLARVLIVVIFLIATDTLLLRLVYAVLPQFSFFSPLGRLLNLFSFGIALLAGVGFDTCLKKVVRRPLAAAFVASVTLFTAWQLLTYARSINPPFVPREERYLYPETPLIYALEREGAVNGTGSGRIFPVRQSQKHHWTPPVLFAAKSMLFGFDSAGGYDSTLPDRAETLWRIVSGEDLGAVLGRRYRRAFQASFEIDQVRFDLLPRLGVTMIVGPPELPYDPLWKPDRYAPLKLTLLYSGVDGCIFRIDGATGGPWVVHRAAVVENDTAALEVFLETKFAVTDSAVIELATPEADTAPPPTSGTARVREDGINTLGVSVTSSHPGWLVVPNTWDPGWRAWVNGRETKVLRANYTFQAIAIPAGTSDVRLCYRPSGLFAGSLISTLSVVLAAAAWLLRARGGD